MELTRKRSYYSYLKPQIFIVLVVTVLIIVLGVRDEMSLKRMASLVFVMIAVLAVALLVIHQRKHHPDKLNFSNSSIVLNYPNGKVDKIIFEDIKSVRKTASYRPGVFPTDLLVNLKQGGYRVIQTSSLVDSEGNTVNTDEIVDYVRAKLK